MKIIFFDNWSIEKKTLALKIGAVVSFLLILVPGAGSDPELMAVVITAFFRDLLLRKNPYFDFFSVLQILYLAALIFLVAFSHTSKKATEIGILIAIGFLWIPCLLIFCYLLFAGAFLNLAIVTIALFSFFAIRLIVIYRKRLRKAT